MIVTESKFRVVCIFVWQDHPYHLGVFKLHTKFYDSWSSSLWIVQPQTQWYKYFILLYLHIRYRVKRISCKIDHTRSKYFGFGLNNSIIFSCLIFEKVIYKNLFFSRSYHIGNLFVLLIVIGHHIVYAW